MLPGPIEGSHSLLDPPMPHVQVLRNSHPIIHVHPWQQLRMRSIYVLCLCKGSPRRPRDFSEDSPPKTSPIDLLAWALAPPAAQTFGFSPHNVPALNPAPVRLPLGSLDFNTPSTPTARLDVPPARLPLRALRPNTPTATPTRRMHTEVQRSVRKMGKRARFTQQTEGQRLHEAHQRRRKREVISAAARRRACHIQVNTGFCA